MMANQDQLVPLVPVVQLVPWAFQDQKASLSVGEKLFIFFFSAQQHDNLPLSYFMLRSMMKNVEFGEILWP